MDRLGRRPRTWELDPAWPPAAVWLGGSTPALWGWFRADPVWVVVGLRWPVWRCLVEAGGSGVNGKLGWSGSPRLGFVLVLLDQVGRQHLGR